jgi:hypothetical protein
LNPRRLLKQNDKGWQFLSDEAARFFHDDVASSHIKIGKQGTSRISSASEELLVLDSIELDEAKAFVCATLKSNTNQETRSNEEFCH